MVSAVLAVTQVYLRAPVYRSETSFLTEGGRTSSVSSIAAQFGIGGGGTEGFASPQIYGDVAASGNFLRRVAAGRPGGEFGDQTFADLVEGKGATPAERLQDAAEEVGKMVDIEAAPRTGLVTVRAQAPSPQLAKALADEVLSQLSQMRVAVRVNRAATERVFLEERLRLAHADLRSAEDRLQGFLQRNRAFENDPARSIEHSRLMREATLKEEIYSGILYGLEQVKADEQRTASGMMLVGPAEVPVRPEPKSFALPAIAAFLLGVVAAAMVVGLRASLSGDLGAVSEAQLRSSLREIADDLRRGRIVRALLGSRAA